jgi:hypothetical protein
MHRPEAFSRRRTCLGLAALSVVAGSWPLRSGAQETPLLADVIDIPPWGLRGQDGRADGVYADLLRAISERSRCPMTLRIVPIQRSIQDLGQGVSQISMMLDRKDMNDAGLTLGTVVRLTVQIWLPLGSPVRTVEDLAGRTVAVLRGPTYHEGVQTDPRIAKYPVSSPRQQLDMLRIGRVDAALGVEQNFLVAARALNLRSDAFAPPLQLGGREVKLWLARGLAQHPCQQRLTDALKSLRDDGSITRRMLSAAPER